MPYTAKTVLLFVAVAVFVLFQCSSTTKTGTDDVGKAVSTAGVTTEAPTVAPVAALNIGDTADAGKGATIMLESASVTPEGIVAIFVLDNTAGTDSRSESSMMSFEVKDDAGNTGDATITVDGPEGVGDFGGTVATGEKLRGYVAFKPMTGAGLKLVYKPNVFGDERVVWTLGQ